MSWPASVRIVAFCAGLGLVGWGIVERHSFTRVKAAGVEAVVEPDIEFRESRGSRGAITYFGNFAFVAANGERVVAREREFPEALLGDIAARRPIRVRYEAARPANFVFDKEDPPWTWVLAGIILIVVAAVRK